MDVHVSLVARRQWTLRKTIRKLSFTPLLLRVVREIYLLRVCGLKAASLNSAGKKEAPNVDYWVLKKF